MKTVILLFITILYLNATVYYGEGSGKSYEEAKRKALEDVASQISVVIDSKIEETQSVKNDKYHKNFDELINLIQNKNYATIKVIIRPR